MAYYQIGNTIHFSAKFYDFDGNLVDPQLIKLVIYDEKYNQIEEIIVGASNKVQTGMYFLDYITKASQQGKFYSEWYGEIDGTPSLKRESFTLGFL